MIYGVRFYRASVKVEKGNGAPIFVHSSLDENRSDFDFIFRCIYEALSDLMFLENDAEPFVCADEDYKSLALQTQFDERPLLKHYRHAAMPANALQKFGCRVTDDWNQTIFFARDVLSANGLTLQDIVKIDNAADGSAFAQCPAARVLLHNWDGVYWEIFCKDRELIDILLQNHREEPRLRICYVDLALDYPDPRNAPLEKA